MTFRPSSALCRTLVDVLGAGYSGLAAAKLAAKRTTAKATLINASDRFVERVRPARRADPIQFVRADDSPVEAVLTAVT